MEGDGRKSLPQKSLKRNTDDLLDEEMLRAEDGGEVEESEHASDRQQERVASADADYVFEGRGDEDEREDSDSGQHGGSDDSYGDDDDDDNMPPKEATGLAVRWFLGATAPKTTHRTGLAYDERMRNHHHPYQKHPECPERVETIMMALEATGLASEMYRLPIDLAMDSEIRLVHSAEHIGFVKALRDDSFRKSIHYNLEHKSAFASEGTVEAAYVSAGCVLSALDHVHKNTIRNAICVVRPPGHHAEKSVVCGFCLFDNVAVAAAAAIKQYNYQRVLVVDWDIHHGNGIQHAFEDTSKVLYISLHRWDHGQFYPGGPDGGPKKVGVGAGRGYNINIGWNGRGPYGDGEYLAAFDSVVMPAARAYEPDLVFVSAGFDAAIGDPLGGCHVTPSGFGQMLNSLCSLAAGRVIVALEGGYNLASISASMVCCASVLLGEALPIRSPSNRREVSLDARRAISRTLMAHAQLDVPFSNIWTSAHAEEYTTGKATQYDNTASESSDVDEDEEEERHRRVERDDEDEAVISPRARPDNERHQRFTEEALLIANVHESSPNIREHIQPPPSIQDGRPQIDAPCDECLRVRSGADGRGSGANDRDNWVCFKCYSVFCWTEGKDGHAKDHARMTGHRIAMRLRDFMIWDFESNTFLDGVSNPYLRPILEEFHQDKFGEPLPPVRSSFEQAQSMEDD